MYNKRGATNAGDEGEKVWALRLDFLSALGGLCLRGGDLFCDDEVLLSAG